MSIEAVQLLCGAMFGALFVLLVLYKRKPTFFLWGLLLVSTVYLLFAVYSFNFLWIAIEMAGLLFFSSLVYLGFKYSYWFAFLGWLIHPLWDNILHPQQAAPYIWSWYPILCMGFDFVVAAGLLLRCASYDAQRHCSK